MFSFPLLHGNATTVFNNANSIVITQRLAEKIFSGENPIGKTITTPDGDLFSVTGVLQNLPSNTQFKFEYLLPWDYIQTKGQSAGN